MGTETMARPNRTEKRDETRRRLLEAARWLYLKRGLDGVSIDGVAEAAGFSKGAVYANFEDKEALILSVWRAHFEAKNDRFTEALERKAPEAMMAALREAMVAIFAEGSWPHFAAEIRRHREYSVLVAELAIMERAEIEGLRQVVGEIYRRFGRDPGPCLAETTATLFALGEGLILRAEADGASPETSADRFMAVLRAMVAAE